MFFRIAPHAPITISLKNLVPDLIPKSSLRNLALGCLPCAEPLFSLFAFLLAFGYAIVAEKNIIRFFRLLAFFVDPGESYRDCFAITMSATPASPVQKGFLDEIRGERLTF